MSLHTKTITRQKTIKIARHPEVVTMYRIVQGDKILTDNLKTLDDALSWQIMHCWYKNYHHEF